jgi:EmrB/QacA subfamily drug resistance transporter
MDARSRRKWVLALTAVASLMISLDILVVSTALTEIRRALGASIEALEWTVNAYVLTFAVLLMTASALGDRFGRRRVFAAGFGLFSVASAGCALAPNAGWLVAARAVQGAGAAVLAPLALALLGAAFPPERRGWAVGMLSGITGLATVGGPIIGGAVTQMIGWKWIFWLNVPIGLLAIPFVITRLEESFGPKAALDVRGLALVSAGVLGMVWGLVRASGQGFGRLDVLAPLAVGAILIVAFVVQELRARAPMLPMRLFRSRTFSAGNAACFLLFATITGSVFLMAQYLQTGLGYGPLDTGLRLIPWTAMLVVVAPIAGTLVDRFGSRPVIVVGLTLSTVGMAWLAAIATPGIAYAVLVLPLIVGGIGNSMTIPAAISAVVGSVRPEDIGKASGVNSTVRQLGGVFGVAILALVFTATGGYASAATFNDGFVAAMATGAVFTLAGAAAGLVVTGRPRAAAPASAAKTGRTGAETSSNINCPC